ncbi:TIGR04104 family putative zinc finger protein [Planococcus sp. ISL-110]|uniref:TIGR04104 family putative zinc finger protein n=1 Tax=Planococcus sp. ISL-110 TaxID=2819167 RepID=UPI001BED1484|nr:TIGR04104 family putative zinc finger protein [Planococcus sp. ISL-110]MBT2570248.1 hypothetical protein [Planococcus sp. ISL-110]
MQQCEGCHTPFTWKQVSKSLLMAYKPIACPNCGKRHKVQFLSRILASSVMVGSLYAGYFFTALTGPGTLLFSMLVTIPAVLLVLPYLMRYRLA